MACFVIDSFDGSIRLLRPPETQQDFADLGAALQANAQGATPGGEGAEQYSQVALFGAICLAISKVLPP